MSYMSYHSHGAQAGREIWLRARGGLYVTVKAIRDKFITPQFIQLQWKRNRSVNFSA